MASYSDVFKTDYGKQQQNEQEYLKRTGGIANQQYNQAQNALQNYGERAAAAVDPEAAGRMRQGFESTLEQTRGMIPGMAFQGLPTGYTPQEKRGMQIATTAPIEGAFRSAGEDIANHSIRTGSSTGVAADQMKLAQMRGLSLAPALAGLQAQFGDARRQDEGRNEGFRQSANNMMANTGLSTASEYGQGEGRNVGYIPQVFQFPVSTQFGNYNAAQEQQTTAMGQQNTLSEQMRLKSMQPGFLKQLALNAASGAGQALGAAGMKSLGA